jgi:hypothetical protein
MNAAVFLATLALVLTIGMSVWVAAIHIDRILAHSRNARDRLAARIYPDEIMRGYRPPERPNR